MMQLYSLKTNERLHPVGIDGPIYFSWKFSSEKENVVQTAYRIEIPGVWDTKKVESSEQAFLPYEGPSLAPCREYRWRVTVWDNTGEEGQAEAVFETASPDWKGAWVESSIPRKKAEYNYGLQDAEALMQMKKEQENPGFPAVMFFRSFRLQEKNIVRARIYATAFGVYRLRVNGKRPDDREFAPEFTSYEKLHYYQTYDVTKLLYAGENELSFYVGDGWYFSNQASPVFGERNAAPSILYQLEVVYEDGTKETVFSDGRETCAVGTVVYSDVFQGEMQDLRKGFADRHSVVIKDYEYHMLMAQPMDPIRPVKLIPAVDVFTTPKGEVIVDFGQVMAGRARIRLDLPKDTQVTFEYFEVLDIDGNYINTMFPAQKDTVISAGEPVLHEALFTFHGFRYIRVTGMEHVRKEDFTAVLLTTEKENLGSFACSEERLTKLYRNIRWSQYNNMMSVPTDCPSREKAGWTGDILIYAKAALTNENVTAFLTSWLKNVRADQRKGGEIMITSPFERLYDSLMRNVCLSFGDEQPTNVAGWSDVIVWLPYEMYRVTGNQAVLRENLEAMQSFCDNVIRTAHEKRGYLDIPEEYDKWLFNTGFHFGEWLIPSEPVGGFEICKASSYYIAPMFAYMSMQKMAEICRILGEDGTKYTEAATQMKNAFIQGMIYGNRMPEDKMGAYVLAFAFGLVPEDKWEEYAEKLVRLLEANGRCLDTGFLATPFLLDALCLIGRKDLAHALLWQNQMPSWLYEVEHGATAIWEAWNADEARTTGRFVSFDHYAFGIVDDWIMRKLCGIDTDTPGYSHIIIAPEQDGKITWLKRSFETIHGKVSVEYDEDNLAVQIPANTTATICWKGKQVEVGSGCYKF
ncbi:MAG: family 78 glycoside hydrolase catalytic domain [Blautia sp.]|nr:family 78 glycoside hydrolase catalytic domain [Blautia sp.]